MSARPHLVDSHGRTVRDLRISVTDRCNLRCTYCMPAEGMPWLPHEAILTYEEIARIARVAMECGVTGVRLTGGEPTVRKGLTTLVRQLRALSPALDLSMTTNGIALRELAGELREAGLDRLNVSLDTLDRDRFVALARRDKLADVLAGIAAAKVAGFAPIKINTVLMRGFNEDEAVALASWAREEGFELRFIEWMPLDFQQQWDRTKLVSGEETRAAIHAVHPLDPAEGDDPSAPARPWRYRDGKGRVGFVASVSNPFCGSCDRIRLTADGQVRTCLFALKEWDFRALLREGATDGQIEQLLRDAVLRKQPGHLIGQAAFRQPDRGMSAIGG
ncbi:MAG: GTP 3',8-cyclase MoaA [Candidatus Eisenbacteria bacterium]|uniref:GTP 3',8-cyclase n=1 Tax=Eiseniibacteriota bacterium TaxID=2212470 RepID=A0A933W7A3_UNCEI|nr:GTP 3',8-cyclase MoaA [Candidatus Eisenbacteria bacterium]